MVQVEKIKWIVLRGLGRGYGHWGSFQQKMRDAFPHDEIYFIDLPGNGILNGEMSPLKISQYVSFLENQLKMSAFFETNGPVYGIGLSLGGMVMIEWANQFEDFFTKIFLINTSASNFSKPWKRISIPVFLNTAKQVFKNTIENLEMNSLKITTSLSEDQIRTQFGEDYKSNIAFTKKYPITKENVMRQLFAASKYFFPKVMKTPVVLINGANDRFVNPSCSLDIQSVWKCKLVTHPTAGHDVAFEDAKWLIDLVKNEIQPNLL
ncbi:MAG: alpha/beta hydrolase [Bdellovibrio sp.]|nr:alpha/beta hydrolase [Bdellovibrio sp.]